MRRKIATLVIAGGAVMALAAPMSTAQAVSTTSQGITRSCTTWYDANTFGSGCKGGAGVFFMYASAQCKDGKQVFGEEVLITASSSYVWSYADCSAHGGYEIGTGRYSIEGGHGVSVRMR
ncbi:hypothetical protein SBI_07714 [Streptomyces bingchenggensis BCW-1]|uniref:Uncharacterized protein n=1 Tax=Streptomyces bingchenggensis (strain BCW-1) TaxID=749414 RepID=D7CCY7_STRBB|nr:MULTISPECIES: hypothetical protein [Streptomyces]ADI10834.1 hypothetical protein SBI_07714 [Streptomyces bingchenggensis BCW-1]